MPAAIYYDGYTPEPGRPVGIDVATEEFVKAFLRHARQETLYAVTPNDRAFQQFCDAAAAQGVPRARCQSIDPQDAGGLTQAGNLFRYEPDIQSYLWDRRASGQRDYSICGITHTSSTARVMDVLGGLVTAPTQPWDALICASAAIKSAITELLENWGEYLAERFSAPPITPTLQLPVIPLGVDVSRIGAVTEDAERNRQREQLGLGVNDIVVLFIGRLSHFAKANPFPLLLAGEQVAGETEKTVHLLFYGHFPDDITENAYRTSAAEICQTARVHFVMEGSAEYPQGPWAGADIFCSPVDNIQESFGLTPIEAMAAGLPVIVSDWDGYRDTVRHEIDGFMLPTLMPQAGTGIDLAERHRRGIDGYADYIGAAAQATAVDVGSLAKVLRQLVESENLRRRMGEAGRDRAANRFDWPHIIRAYEDLWDELAEQRRKAEEHAPLISGNAPHPLRPDPFAMFSSFAAGAISGPDTIELAISDWNEALERIKSPVTMFNAPTLIELEDIPLVIGHLEATNGCTVDDITAGLEGIDRYQLIRTLGWLIKLGICKYRAG